MNQNRYIYLNNGEAWNIFTRSHVKNKIILSFIHPPPYYKYKFIYTFKSFASIGFRRIFQKCVCASACTQKTSKLRCWFLKRRLTTTPRRHRLADIQLSYLYPPLPQVSARSAPPLWCCAVPLFLPVGVGAHPEDRLCTIRLSVSSSIYWIFNHFANI